MIPASIDDVTAEWLSEVLGAKINTIQPTQIGQGVGLMGDIFRVELDGDGPASVVVKLPSSFEGNREQGVALGMFEAEIRFYKELGHEAHVGLPKIYHAEIVSGTAEFVLVMEDLSHLSMVQQADGMSVDQAMAAVKVLASIHGVWWGRVQTPDFEWIPDMIGPRIEYVDQLLVDILPGYLENFGRYLPEGGAEIYSNFAGNYLAVNRTLAGRSPWTLVHQDYRVENLMFGAEGTDEVAVLDWQGIGRGPGAYDLAYVLGGSMDTELRRANEDALLQTYYDGLLSAGVEDYSFDQLQEDYAMAHLQGGLATSMVTGGTLDLSNERGIELVSIMSRRHVVAAMDHDGLVRLKAVQAT